VLSRSSPPRTARSYTCNGARLRPSRYSRCPITSTAGGDDILVLSVRGAPGAGPAPPLGSTLDDEQRLFFAVTRVEVAASAEAAAGWGSGGGGSAGGDGAVDTEPGSSGGPRWTLVHQRVVLGEDTVRQERGHEACTVWHGITHGLVCRRDMSGMAWTASGGVPVLLVRRHNPTGTRRASSRVGACQHACSCCPDQLQLALALSTALAPH
jgi:hypothetical protein